jgi:hypothetical protein
MLTTQLGHSKMLSMKFCSVAAYIVVAICVSGCTTLVTPPTKTERPQKVLLLDYGGHAALCLPRQNSLAACYSYGDWRWYGLGQKNLWTGVAALFWPTRAVLKRQPLAEIGDAVAIYEFEAERERVTALREELDSILKDDKAEMAEHPRRYTILHNSNGVMIEWLRRLDCDVRHGWTLLSRWKVGQPGNSVVKQ